jgi:hypothetical protein
MEQEIQKMELLITLNENIVVQRFFNVKGFNPSSTRSVELYDYMYNLKNDLEYLLKMKTVEYMVDNKEAIMFDPTIMETSFTDDAENFNIYLKKGNLTICHRIFDGKKFPPKVRYTVDVRPYIKNILRELTELLSSDKLSYNYLNYDLRTEVFN